MVKCDKGVYKTRTIHRIPKEERWDRAAIEEVRFTPWMIKERTAKDELNGCQEQEHKASVDIEINKDIEVELKLPPRHVDPNTPTGLHHEGCGREIWWNRWVSGCTTPLVTL